MVSEWCMFLNRVKGHFWEVEVVSEWCMFLIGFKDIFGRWFQNGACF